MKENRFLIPFHFGHTLEIQQGTTTRDFPCHARLALNSYFLKPSPAKPSGLSELQGPLQNFPSSLEIII